MPGKGKYEKFIPTVMLQTCSFQARSLRLDFLLSLPYLPHRKKFMTETKKPTMLVETSDLPWEVRAERKRNGLLAKIPEEWRLRPIDLSDSVREHRDMTGRVTHNYLERREIDIITKDSVALVKAIRAGHLTAVQVTKAFCKAAAVAHQMSNCLHEFFPDEALERAKQLDEIYEMHKQAGTLDKLGALHGLPVSLKDQFHVKGVDTTMGYVGWIGSNLGITDWSQRHRIESQITKDLQSQGAVLYCKTSVPQTLMLGETINNIFGHTINPRNKKLSCGGSSGGEGALIALGGSSLGIGTDIGGSVRIPAAFCGIFGLKPTPGRLPYRDAANTSPGQTTYASTVGILSSSLSGVTLGLRATLAASPWLNDPTVVPIPFREDVYSSFSSPTSRALKIGVLISDGVVEPHPPVRRAVELLSNAIIRAGHKIVPWVPPNHGINVQQEIHNPILFSDGGADVKSHTTLSGEPIIAPLQETFRPREATGLLEFQRLTLKAVKFQDDYADYWNNSTGLKSEEDKDPDGRTVDAFIMPVAPHAAVIPGKYFYVGYTGVINLLNYSAVTIPVTEADREVDKLDKKYVPSDELDQANWEAYDAEVYDGAPVGVQIVGRKFEEEKVLAIAEVLANVLGKYKAVLAGASGKL
ncbi:Amidase signature domain containing protein [Rhypophila sp. PSN 637]